MQCELDFYIGNLTNKLHYVSRLKTPQMYSLAGSSKACQPWQKILRQLYVEHKDDVAK
jgi:hypothetical protein